MKISYLETETPRGGGISNAELALILEKKYHLLEKFSDSAMSEIVEYVLDFGIDLQAMSEKEFHIMESFIQDKWRDYIELELHGIKTQASKKAGRASFIYTQKYYLGIIPKILI